MDSSSSGSSSSTSSSLSSYRNDILTYTSYLEEIDLRQINDQYERIVLMLQIRCSITQHLTVLVTDGISQTNNHNHDDDDELVNRYGIDQKHCMLCVNETFQLLEMLPKIHSIADHFSSVRPSLKMYRTKSWGKKTKTNSLLLLLCRCLFVYVSLPPILFFNFY